MTTDHRSTLARIKRFDQLICYLRDEMGWPIDSDDFEELTFEYTPEELGIDAKNAAKIQEIKRLRPFTPNQPWGIFFIKFEPKKLPVVALRRILSQVALKKRSSANSAERAAWAADDLLFVSNYGEGDERRISFAHFSKAQDGHDLPTLKVLGWDNLDTALHLDAVAKELTENLTWPEDDADVEAWRQRWRAAFTLRHREVVTTSKELSIRLAELARAIRDRIKAALAIETEVGPLTKLMKAFQETLVHDLDQSGFADMYAQTITYGLLSARIADPHRKTADDFSAHMRTNPFLRELMETFLKVGGRRGKAGGPGIDFDELGVSEVVELLDDANMEAVVRDFGDKNPQEDPVIHFYELFLKEYDAKKRMQRGVFYTPRPVVSYIVRSVDELLRTEFGLADGLADITTWAEMAKRYKNLKIPEGVPADQPFVQILDPACGTGTFLVEVIDLIHKTLTAKWKTEGHVEIKIAELWNKYVPTHLLPRLHGYELLMAPYAIAHLKIGLKLYETGYRFGSDERARIYLTNALEPPSALADARAAGLFEALGHEAQAVNDIKLKQNFTVVIGNPPYSIFSANMTQAAKALVDQYRHIEGLKVKEKGALKAEVILQDDYVKFLALAQRTVVATGAGLIGFITNSNCYTNPVLRGLRYSLLKNFSRIFGLDLGGQTKADIGDDANVFDIGTGVAVSVLARSPNSGQVRRFGVLRGSRTAKYSLLSGTTCTAACSVDVTPGPDQYLFRVFKSGHDVEYQAYFPVDRIFEVTSIGIKTARDHLVLDFEREVLEQRMNCLRDTNNTTQAIRERFSILDNTQWNFDKARREFQKTFSESHFSLVDARPFDTRWLYFHPSVVFNTRPTVNKHVHHRKNLCLLAMRRIRTETYAHFFVTKRIGMGEILSSADNCNFFPLYVYYDDLLRSHSSTSSNFSREFLNQVAQRLHTRIDDSASIGTTPKEIFYYAYAVFHSPGYRSRYAEFLKIDFPRLPLTSDLDLFRDVARLGDELVALHLMESPKLDHLITTYTGPKNPPKVERIGWSDGTVWLDTAATKKGQPAKPGTIGFQGVPEAVWNFHIGGYQVCEKWLKDRKGRTLSKEDIVHYQKIVVALAETIRLMQEIDKVIEKHGGWPGAFQIGEAKVVQPGEGLLKVAEPRREYGSGMDKKKR